MQHIVLHLDMNSYFASVEQQSNPLLRGKPVGVCAYLSSRGCIIACSVEAKRYGVKTGMRVYDAKKICPQIVLLVNDPAKYRFVSERIFAILERYADRLEIYSIDEAFVDLTGLVSDFSEASKLATVIKDHIRKEIGDWLKCSVGIASTRWLAKFASEEKKPDGLTVIKNEDLDRILVNRPLQHAWGIASALEKRLKALGINNLLDLKNYNPNRLRQVLGINGYYLWAAVNGVEIGGLQDYSKRGPKSVGHSYCIPKQTADLDYLRSVMLKLCVKTGRRLRQQGLEARGLRAGFSFINGGGVWHSWKLDRAIYDSLDIYKEAKKLIKRSLVIKRVRMLAVALFSLSQESDQLSFFNDQIKKKRLTKALDNINNTFGEYAIIPGVLLPLREQAQDRIGFRKSVKPGERIISEFYVSE